MTNLIAVFIGGGLGSLCRYGIANIETLSKSTFPYATLIANALSCIVLGFFFVLVQNHPFFSNGNIKLLILTGFCGGFSTYSTFTNETYLLLQNGEWTYALLNIFGNLSLCLICIFVGVSLGKLFQ